MTTLSAQDDDLHRIFARRTPLVLPPDPMRRQAAVLLPLLKGASDYHLVLTKRTETLRHHKGQVSFPGGTFEPADRDLLTTALRESYEEVGIHPKDVRVLGRLDDLATFSTSFLIAPFVGVIPHPYVFVQTPPKWLPCSTYPSRCCPIPRWSAAISGPVRIKPHWSIMNSTSVAT